MITYDKEINGKEYSFRLTTKNVTKLEEVLHKNALSVLGEIPNTREICTILYYALKECHKAEFKAMDDVYSFYDEYVDNGGNITEMMDLLTQIYIVSGLIPKDDEIEEGEEELDPNL